MEFVSKSAGETAKIASGFAKAILEKSDFVKNKVAKAAIVGLYGELGSGKTTFIKFLAEAFGIKETIQSPTFVIMKSFSLSLFPSFNKLIHVDAYRIEKEEEMLKLGWQEIISNPQNLILVEWPERISEIMPPHTRIFFEYGSSENERKIIIKDE